MRKWLLAAALTALLASVGFGAAEARSDALVGTFVTNTSTRGIALDSEIYWTLVRPQTADVIITVYNMGSVKCTATVLAGESWCFETSGMDSVRVARATTTIVDYALSTRKEEKPSLEPSVGPTLTTIDTAVDSVVTLLSSPEVRTFSTGSIFDDLIWNAEETHVTGPLTGLYVDGAKSIKLIGKVASLVNGGQFNNAGGGTAKIRYWYRFSSLPDSIYSGCGWDSTDAYQSALIDSAQAVSHKDVGGNWTPFVLDVPCPAACFSGYFFLTIESTWGIIDLIHYDVNYRVVW